MLSFVVFVRCATSVQLLQRRLTHSTHNMRSSGGVILTSADGRIVCANTLDDRIAISYQGNLPEIRAQLFGKTAAVH